MATKYDKLQTAVEKLYYSAYWHPDRPVDNEVQLWEDVRDAAGFSPGECKKQLGSDQQPTPMRMPLWMLACLFLVLGLLLGGLSAIL